MARAKLYWDELARRLMLERAKRGWTAEYVADRAGLGSKDTVLKAETGQRKPNAATIVRFEQAFGLTEGELLRLVHDGPDTPPGAEEFERIGREWVRTHRSEVMRMLMEEIDGATGSG